MKIMETKLVKQAIPENTCDVLVVGVARDNQGTESNHLILSPAAREVNQLLDGLLTTMYENGEFKAHLGELTQIYTMGKMRARRVLVVGLGKAEQIRVHTLRRASGVAARFAQSKGATQIALALEMSEGVGSSDEEVQAIAEGARLSTYSFNKYHTMRSNGHSLERIEVLSAQAESKTRQEALERGIVMADAANFTREMVNESPSVLTPTEMANRARAMAGQFGLECEIIERPQMEELGMGGLLAVSKGSATPPTFTILRYRGAPQSTATLALVGKGVTFDSGGISIKPGAGMEAMKGDMGGAGAVIGAMQIIGALKPAINVTAYVPSTENMPDGASYRPGDVLRILNGKTIEIVNTDAEGRLILADALSYAVRENCSPIIDIATLTGGCVVALGGLRAGLFCNDDELRDQLMAVGEQTGEKFWPLPLDDDYQEKIESSIADIKQTGGRGASAVTAAKILEHFVGDARWAHLDIAGTEFMEGKTAFMGPGASGFGARALASLVLRRAAR